MKTSLNDLHEIDEYLSGTMPAGESIIFQVKLITDPITRVNVLLQQKVHEILRLYQRKKIRAEIQKTHDRIFSDPDKADFRQRITHLFNHRANG